MKFRPCATFKPERVNVGDEQQHARELLAAIDDAELRRLLDRVGGVAAGIGEADDLGLGALRLQQEGGEVGIVERMLDSLPSTLPPLAVTTAAVSRSSA